MTHDGGTLEGMRHLLLLFAFLVACAAPQRPTYDSDCVPSSSVFVDAARSTADRTPLDEVPPTARAARDAAFDGIRALGFMIREKQPGDARAFERWSQASSTLPGVVLLETDWSSKSDAEQAATAEHERTHAEQQTRMGVRAFFAWWAMPEGRWALETAAFAQGFAVAVHLGADPEGLKLEDAAVRFHDRYALGAMPACTQATTVGVWREAIGVAP